MDTKLFSNRHIGITIDDESQMLSDLQLQSTDELIKQTIPNNILNPNTLNLPKAISEYEMLQLSQTLAEQNISHKNYIGFGYYGTILPSVIQRNILENPGWYTAYTPYQAEIAQGRLEALLNYQTMVCDLTGFPIANASLLDESTAAAEAMHMLYEARTRDQKNANSNQFFISEEVLPQTILVMQSKAEALGIKIIIGNHSTIQLQENFFGALLQYPAKSGVIYDYSDFITSNKEKNIKTILACDLLSLTLLRSPFELGADVAVGTTQRFGIPLGFGGPHAAYFACLEDYKRIIPGRIIGVSTDKYGKRALRMALQTREQHIKREKATSNICTAQVLLAVMAGMYATYHGKEGLLQIANEVNQKASLLANSLKQLGFEIESEDFFDTISIKISETEKEKVKEYFEDLAILLNYFNQDKISISIDETTSDDDLMDLISAFAEYKNANIDEVHSNNSIPENLQRTSDFLSNEVFTKYRTETELMRYIKRLERKDLSLNHSMISLGSCTMKLNAATQMIPLSWANWGNIHPFVPNDFAKGYLTMITELENYLSEITGFAATSLQPNSGAQGEYAGLMVIREYFKAKGENHRNIALIPQSAHGTNPASAVLAGMKVVVVKNLENGHFDFDDLKAKAEEHKDNLAALMITYPSTYGFFDDNVKEITKLIHDCGGQVYMDGANMNAQVGLTNPAIIGADVCHLNLHKTFAIPHGGGGPGVGPICVAEHLAEHLPKKSINENGLRISAANFGSALILNISYSYIRMLGFEGLKKSTEMAILNANYLKYKLEKHFAILYQNENGRVAHELIVDFRPFKAVGIEVADVAKRLMDYGFHAPTVSFPVAGTLMIEPTESESLEELNRFAEALISIKNEIDEVAEGKYSKESNVVKNAPHTLDLITADAWTFEYSREKAAYPLDWVRERKFFATVSRIDEAAGDRNLICTCEPIESYMN